MLAIIVVCITDSENMIALRGTLPKPCVVASIAWFQIDLQAVVRGLPHAISPVAQQFILDGVPERVVTPVRIAAVPQVGIDLVSRSMRGWIAIVVRRGVGDCADRLKARW